jgi:anthranilate phosphoribosyltransferase
VSQPESSRAGAVSASRNKPVPTPRMTWPELFGRLLAGQDLGARDTAWVMDEALAGDATDVQLAGFLISLRAKGGGRRAR